MAQHPEHGARIVIGAGPDALRAAAVRASQGDAVLLLQAGPSPSGLVHPELPQDTGRMRVADGHRQLTEQVLGALVEAPDNGQGVLVRGQVLWLPLGRRQVPGLVPPAHLLPFVRSYVDARSRSRASEVVPGSGREERSYRDWVVRRMGEPAYRLLYQGYATRRFGAAADDLSVTAARHYHGNPDPGPHQVAGGRPHVALLEAETCIRQAGGAIRTGVQVEALEVDGGRVVAVRLVGGERILAEGPVWVACPPRQVVEWLPHAEVETVQHDAQRLASADLRVVCLKGEVDGLPEVLHVLDDAGFWQVVTPYGIKEYALFLSTLPSEAPDEEPAAVARSVADDARRLGLGDFELDGARIERIRGHQPVWSAGCHVRFHRVVDRLSALGVVLVGRTGAFGPLDAGEEIALASAYVGAESPDQREALRSIAEPPVRLPDLRSTVRRFIER